MSKRIISEIGCPECKSGVLVPISGGGIKDEDEEYYCGCCNKIFTRTQLTGIMFASTARERVNDIDLAEERAHLTNESNLHEVMQEESIDNLMHDIHMRKLAGKVAV